MATTSIELTEVLTTPESAVKGSIRRPSVQPLPDDFKNPITGRAEPENNLSKRRSTAIIACVTLITSISTLLNGLTTVALPRMSEELHIPAGLILWPTSIQALTCGCTLLVSGSLADALGPRLIYLVGCVLQAGFVLGCGLARDPFQIILFRGLSGIAISLCLPSSVSIITKSFSGRRRNFAFAAMGGGQPIGFSLGLALGGVLTDTIGWRYGFYISSILSIVILGVAVWGLPASLDYATSADSTDLTPMTWNERIEQLQHDVDWVGALIGSVSLALLSYVLAALTGTARSIKEPSSIAMLALAVALVPAFIAWVGRQESKGRPAIIPNSLWRNQVFTTICITCFLTWGSFNALETILTFYFQDVQKLSAIQASIRFLPSPVSGALANVAMGILVSRVRANWLTFAGCILSAVAPLVMAFAKPDSNYWSSGFLANALNPAGADCLFTISNLLITSVFSAKTQSLAGGVFNTVSQLGKSVGIALAAVIYSTVTASSDYADKHSPDALMEGYNAAFWFCFAMTVATLAISMWGLRDIGMVGHKRD